MAIQLIPTLAPAPQQASQALGQSDEQLDQIRQYIAALRAAKQPVQHWAQGASNLAGDLLEGAARGKINDSLGARQAGATQEYVRALNTPGSQPDETSLSTGPSGGPAARPQAAGAGVPSTAAAPMAPGGDDLLTRIASIVNQGETGRGANFDAHTLASESHDTNGSISSGFMGLNSKTGSAATFARNYPELGITAPPGTPEFRSQWKDASFNKTDAMRKAQMDHFDKTQVQPTYADLQKLGIPTAIASDPRVLGYFTDRHVQQGKLGQDNIVSAYQASGNDPVKFLHNIDQMDGTGQSLQRFFPNALAQGIYSARGHATRLATRLGGALGLGASEAALAASPNTPDQAAGGSGIDPHVQSMVQVLAGQQTAQAGPPGAQPPRAIGAPPSGGTLTPMQHMANFLAMGYSPAQARQRVDEMQGMMPQYKYDDPHGREYTETPGQPRRYTGRQFGPGKEVTQGGIAFSESLGPNGGVIRTPIRPRWQDTPGVAPGGAPNATAPNDVWAPKQGPPAFPRNDAELYAWPAKMEAYKSYQVEGGKKGAELDVANLPENQAAALQSAAAKSGAEEQAKTDVKYFDTLYKGITGSGTIAAQQKQNIDILRQIADSKDFTPGFGSEVALGLQRLASQLGVNPAGAAPREVFNQIAARVLADQFSGMKSMASETGEAGGRIFKSMLDVEEKANITPQDTLEGVKTKLNLLDRTGDLMMKWADLADDYKAEHGRLDSGFNKQLRAAVAAARLPELLPKKEAPPASSEAKRPTYQTAPPPGSVPVPARP